MQRSRHGQCMEMHVRWCAVLAAAACVLTDTHFNIPCRSFRLLPRGQIDPTLFVDSEKPKTWIVSYTSRVTRDCVRLVTRQVDYNYLTDQATISIVAHHPNDTQITYNFLHKENNAFKLISKSTKATLFLLYTDQNLTVTATCVSIRQNVSRVYTDLLVNATDLQLTNQQRLSIEDVLSYIEYNPPDLHIFDPYRCLCLRKLECP